MSRLVIVLVVGCGVACTSTQGPAPKVEVAVEPAAPPVGVKADGSCAIDGHIEEGPGVRVSIMPKGLAANYRADRLTRLDEGFRGNEYEYDEQGRLIRERFGGRNSAVPVAGDQFPQYAEISYGADGSSVERRNYGERVTCTPRPAEHEYVCEGEGQGASGRWTRRETYDRQGRLVRSAIDYLKSDTSDMVVVRTYDDAARTLHETRDFDNDGVVDREDLVSFDADDRVTRIVGSSAGPGEPPVAFDTRITYTKDPFGRVKCRRTTHTAPQPADDERCFEYDERGNVIRETRTGDGQTVTMRYEGTFTNMRCGALTIPERHDDNEWALAGRLKREWLRGVMRSDQ